MEMHRVEAASQCRRGSSKLDSPAVRTSDQKTNEQEAHGDQRYDSRRRTAKSCCWF